MVPVDEQLQCCEVCSWPDVPATLLCHVLTLIPYKRADVKCVCRNWRAAVNSSLCSVSLPADQLTVLAQLDSIRHLTLLSSRQHQQRSAQHLHGQLLAAGSVCRQAPGSRLCCEPQLGQWPPSCHRAVPGPCTSSNRPAAGSNDRLTAATAGLAHTAAGGWPVLLPKVLSNLVTLRLKAGPDGVQQLVALLTELNQTSSDNSQHQPQAVLCSVQVLEVQEAGDLAVCLPVLLSHCGWPVAEQLQQLCVSQGSVASICGNQQLPQLPALQELQLLDCGLQHLPAWVEGNCSGLTKLVLRNNTFHRLPAAVSGLKALKVLDVSGCGQLRSLCTAVWQLTALEELHLAGASGLWLDYSSIADDVGAPEPLTATEGLPGSGPLDASAARATSGGATSEQRQQRMFKDEQALCQMNSGGSLLDQHGKGSAAAARAALPLLLPALPHQQQQLLLQELSKLQLTYLDLSCNRQLMVLPACLAQLKQLRVLDVRGCGLRWLGEEVLECSSLRELLLADNVLVDVPEEVSRLQQLQLLDLGSCSSLWRLPNSLLQLPELQRLVLPSRGIGQYIVEQLELRSQPDVQVLVEDGCSDEEGFSERSIYTPDYDYDDDDDDDDDDVYRHPLQKWLPRDMLNWT